MFRAEAMFSLVFHHILLTSELAAMSNTFLYNIVYCIDPGIGLTELSVYNKKQLLITGL